MEQRKKWQQEEERHKKIFKEFAECTDPIDVTVKNYDEYVRSNYPDVKMEWYTCTKYLRDIFHRHWMEILHKNRQTYDQDIYRNLIKRFFDAEKETYLKAYEEGRAYRPKYGIESFQRWLYNETLYPIHQMPSYNWFRKYTNDDFAQIREYFDSSGCLIPIRKNEELKQHIDTFINTDHPDRKVTADDFVDWLKREGSYSRPVPEAATIQIIYGSAFAKLNEKRAADIAVIREFILSATNSELKTAAEYIRSLKKAEGMNKDT